MTGPTQHADDLRTRAELAIAKSYGYDTWADVTAVADGEESSIRDAAAAVLKEVVPELARLTDAATAAHTRNAVLRSEHRTEVERLDGALRSAQRGLLRMEKQRDELRVGVLRAAGVDPDTANEDTDYVALLARLSGGNTPANWARQLYDAVVARYGRTDQAATLAEELADLVRGWGSAVATPETPVENMTANIPAVDQGTHSVYVTVREGRVDRTRKLGGAGDEVNVDLDVDYRPLGFEILGAVRVTIDGQSATPAVATPADTQAGKSGQVWADLENFARAYGLADVVPAGVDEVIGARSKRTWYRRPEGWLALERPGDPVRLVSEHSLFVLEGSVSPAPSAVGADPEDEVLLVVAEDRVRRDTGERHDLDEVLAELREDERQHAELNPKMANRAAPPGSTT